MLARLYEEITQVHMPLPVRTFGKANGFYDSLAGGQKLCVFKEGFMHAAQVNEIQGASPHDKEGLHPILLRQLTVLDKGQIAYESAVIVHGELTDAGKLTINQGLVSQAIFIIGNATAATHGLLLNFGLYWKNF
jgi:hypothetical protein